MKKILNAAINIIVPLFITGITTPLMAQETKAANKEEELKLTIQIRPRSEVRNGVFTPILTTQQPAAFVAQRSRIGINYRKGSQLSAGINVQMLNVWGNDPQVQQTASNIGLFEAWVQIYLRPSTQLKVGRQVFSYDDERILGALDWNNAGRKHDAVLLRYKKGKLQTDIAAAYNQNNEKVTSTFFNDSISQPYKAMQFAWLKYTISNSLSFSALAMNMSKQRNTDSMLSYLQTIGVNSFYKKNKFSATTSFYYQTGHANFKNAASQKTSAWMAALYGNYAASKKVTAGLGSDYLSGMTMGSNSLKITTFNPLFGTHHKFYGSMDYFYVSSTHKNVGLWDSYLNFNFNQTEKFTWQIALHHFESAGKIIDYNHFKVKNALGNEVDLSFSYNVMNDVKLTGGYSQMFTGSSMKYVKNISANQSMKPVQNWVWVSFNFNPQIIFKSK